MKKFVSAFLCVTMLMCMLTTMGIASATEDTGGGSAPKWNWTVSKSKTATQLDENKQSTVTLSLPSAEEALSSDVVFVLDKSSCKAETAASAEQMLTSLKDAVTNNKSNIQVGVVVFGGDAKTVYNLQAFPKSDEDVQNLKNAITTRPAGLMGGSNMHAGLLAANEILNNDKNTADSRKYVILVSDGLTRLFTGSDGKTKDIYYQYTYLDPTGEKRVGTGDKEILPKDCVYFGMIDEWTQVRTKQDKLRLIPYGDWNTYFSKVREWVKADGDTYALDYETYGNDPTNKIKNNENGEITDPNFKYIGHNDYENHAMAPDRAVYEAYNSFTEMTDSGFHCYAVLPGSGTPFGTAFMGAMNSYAKNGESVNFNNIGTDILYAVGAGSVIEDKMGDEFDLVPNTFKLTVGGTELASKEDGNVTYFGDAADLNETNYRFKTEYDSADDKFIWTINENVSNFAPVQLLYSVKLTNPSKAPGTYTVSTNKYAKLMPKDSSGKDGAEQTFDNPTVSYTVAPKWNWTVSKSKTATQLDKSAWKSDVTLSLPSAEENLASDVVLVLDASKCTKDMLLATIDLLNDLEKQQENGANIKVGIVMFKGNAVPFQTLNNENGTPVDLKTLKETFRSLIVENDTDGSLTKSAVRKYVAENFPDFMNGGTNIPAGLQLAKNMLSADTAVTDARKYMVLVSDGDTYLFCHENDENDGYDYTKAYTRAGPSERYIGGISEYENWDTGVPVRDKYFAALNSHEWNDYLKYVSENNKNFIKYDFQASAEAFNKGTFPEGFDKKTGLIPESVKDRIINSDVSRYQTAKLYSELQEKYNCYYCFLPGGYDMARTMLKDLTPANRQIDAASKKTNHFSGITEDIVYAIGRGSVIEDKMGDEFDLVPNTFKLTVGGTELASKEDGNVTYFGDAADLNETNYRFKTEYDSADDKFIWTINENVSNFAPVQLSYSVELTNPTSETGTYGIPDLNGDGLNDETGKAYAETDALFTNAEARLTPYDNRGNEGETQYFGKPSVSYTNTNSSGGGSRTKRYTLSFESNGGSNIKPVSVAKNTTVDLSKYITKKEGSSFVGWYTDKELTKKAETVKMTGNTTVYAKWVENNHSDDKKDAGSSKPSYLNTEDHISYIIGYEDGTVRPNSEISRGEVATVFYRLLRDEMRKTNWSRDNSYTDMTLDMWSDSAVSTLSKMGIISGYPDGTFRPDESITRAEFAKVAVNFFEYKVNDYKGVFPDVAEDEWYSGYVEKASDLRLIQGYKDGTFHPDTAITRAEACALVNRMLSRYPDKNNMKIEGLIIWPDCQSDNWFYEDVMEATNSHEYVWTDAKKTTERWTKKLSQRDWLAMENELFGKTDGGNAKKDN